MKRFRLFSLLLLYGLLLSGGGLVPPCQGAEVLLEGQVEAVDFRGRTLSLRHPARRIVCLMESALSGLFMLGAEEQVVGVSANVYQEGTFSYYAAMDRRIAEKILPAPGNWDFVNIERVIALEPDLVIIWSHQEESIRAMEERGIPVFGVFIATLEDVYREILALGALTGTSQRAGQLVEATREGIAAMTSRTAEVVRRPKVYFMWAQGELETSGRNSTVHELITLAGGENVCGSVDQEHLVVSMERILAWDPEVIVMWTNERKNPQDILKNPLWQNVRGVQMQNVHELPDVFSSDLWTLKFQYVVKLVAHWCRPDLFGQVDLQKEKQEVFKRLYGEKVLPALVSR